MYTPCTYYILAEEKGNMGVYIYCIGNNCYLDVPLGLLGSMVSKWVIT